MSRGPTIHSLAIDLDHQHHEQVVLVLDASESAASCQEQIAGAAARVLAGLPAQVECTVFFLGSSTAYSGRDYSAHAADWFGENLGRVSLLGPVMRGIDGLVDVSRTAIIGSGTIFDLEDWVSDKKAKKLALISLDQPLVPDEFSGELPMTRPEDLAVWLHDPVVSITIGSPGWAPLHWDHEGYCLQLADGQFELFTRDERSFNVNISYCSMGAIPDSCEVVRRSGSRESLRIDLAKDSARDQGDTVSLTSEETELFECALEHKDLQCPFCGQTHRCDEQYCHGDSSPKYRFRGRPLYPTLEVANKRGLRLITRHRDEFKCDSRVWTAYPTSTTSLISTHEGDLRAYEYEQADRTWREASSLASKLTKIGQGEYVLHYR